VIDILYEFAGSDPIITRADIEGALSGAGVEPQEFDRVIEELRILSFLGVEIRDGVFAVSDDPRDLQRVDALARRLGKRRGAEARYRIHPAFRPYLEIPDEGDPVMQAA